MKAAKIIELDDGTYAIKPCDVDPEDVQQATPVASLDEAVAMLPDMLAQSAGMPEDDKEPGMAQDAFEAGFAKARGTAMY